MRHHPTPEPSFVADLAAYDASLRCRWGVHSQRWLIERKMPPRSPAWLAERPLNPFGTGPRAKDLWAGWREGYVHVLSVDPSLLHWRLVAPALAETDRQQAGSWEALNRQMDAVDAQAVQRAQTRELAFDEAVMHGAGPARQREARGFVAAGGIVEADIDARGRARAHREVHALPGPGGAEHVR